MAKKIIDTAEWERLVDENIATLEVGDYDAGFCDGLGLAVQFVDALPLADEPRWIPVTERLPEDDYLPLDKAVQIKVLVCNINTGKRSIRTLSRQRVQSRTRENGECRWIWRWEWSKNVRDADITHWMPLPELPEVE